MSKKKDAYLAISAMLRAREPGMLSREKAERMLSAGSFADCAKLLTDCGYEDMSGMKAKEIEELLSKKRAEVFKELAFLAPDARLVDVFRIRYDYHNAKVALKAEAQGLDESGLLSASGRVEPQTLLTAFREDRCRDLPGRLGGALEEAKSVLSRTANPQLADFTLDKAYFAELEDLSRALESDFVTGYVRILADSTNLRSAVRTLRMGRDSGYLLEALVPGGSVSPEKLAASGGGEGLSALFAGSILAEAAQLGAAAAEGGSQTGFELSCDNDVAAYLAKAKLAPYGEETVLAYLAAVESEITAVRMILTGRLAGIAPEVIRERLRDLYA